MMAARNSDTAFDTKPDAEEALAEGMSEVQVDDFKSKSVSGAAAYLIRTILLNVLNSVVLVVITGRLQESEVGVYAIVIQLIGLLTFFSDVGFGSALIQKKTNPTLTEYRSVFTVQQLLSMGIFLVTLVIVLTGSMTAKIGWAGNWVLLALGLSFPLTTLKTIPSIILERQLNFHKLTLPQLIEQVVYNVVLIALLINNAGVMAYAYAIIIRSVVGVGAMWFMQQWSMGFALDISALKTLLGGGVKFQLNDFIARVKDQLFYLALGAWLPNNQFGYISLAKQYSQVPYQLTVQNVVAITFPAYSRLQHSPQLLRRAIEKTLFFIALSIFPLLVGMAVFVYPVVDLVPDYAKWRPALLTFVLFTLSIGWGAISTPLTNTLNALGKINTTLKLMVMWTVLTWVLTPLLVWRVEAFTWPLGPASEWPLRLGYEGVAWAAGIISFTSVAPIYYVKKIVTLDVWDQVWRQLVAAGLMAVVGLLGMSWWGQSWLNLILGMILTSAVYGSSMLVLGKQKLVSEAQSVLGKTKYGHLLAKLG